MARVSIGIVPLSTTAGTVHAGGSLTVADGATIAAGGKTSRLVIRVANTGSAGTVSVVPGTDDPAFRRTVGTVQHTVGATTGVSFFCVESARHAQSDGAIYLDFSSGMNGTIQAYELPDNL